MCQDCRVSNIMSRVMNITVKRGGGCQCCGLSISMMTQFYIFFKNFDRHVMIRQF